ncbi:inactive hydroxysteroid dehydrogenase-like protein 1 [Watersipora subatra]|uniref:inactive hydroxysteroid dehydrogenase-like protein 1 n=1 Tax=Watersipora subatra TaxID=2589382 RepID=UPI00355C13EC
MNADSFQVFINYLSDELKSINDAFAFVGIYLISRKLLTSALVLSDFTKTYIISRVGSRDIAKLYGGKWAVVTGSSDGIGKAYAEQLALRGMNLVLISRDANKLQNTAIQINERFGVQVDFIALTFDGDETKYTELKEELDSKDIAILVNNVGVMYDYPQYFLDVSVEKLWQMVNVNIAATTMMTHIVLPQMVERGKGAIVNIAAGSCSRPTPQLAVYAATKAYIDLFSRSLQYEYSSRGITVQCLMPFYVGARMQRFNRAWRSPSSFIPSAERYARHAVQTLGYSQRTNGYWLHTIQGWIAHILPEWLWVSGANRLNNALRRQAQERVRRNH